jgi:hypothetical protein
MDPKNIPGCTYCHPQMASVGLTEAKAKEAGYDVKVGNFPFMGNGKAIALGEAEGFIKTVFDAKTGELLGAHMVGAEVTELIQGCGGHVVSVFDSGFVLGDGVWEGLRVVDGHASLPRRAFRPLYEGAKAIMLDIGMDRAALKRRSVTRWQRME